MFLAAKCGEKYRESDCSASSIFSVSVGVLMCFDCFVVVLHLSNSKVDLPKHNDLHGGIRPAVPHFGTNNVHKNSDASS